MIWNRKKQMQLQETLNENRRKEFRKIVLEVAFF